MQLSCTGGTVDQGDWRRCGLIQLQSVRISRRQRCPYFCRLFSLVVMVFAAQQVAKYLHRLDMDFGGFQCSHAPATLAMQAVCDADTCQFPPNDLFILNHSCIPPPSSCPHVSPSLVHFVVAGLCFLQQRSRSGLERHLCGLRPWDRTRCWRASSHHVWTLFLTFPFPLPFFFFLRN